MEHASLKTETKKSLTVFLYPASPTTTKGGVNINSQYFRQSNFNHRNKTNKRWV